MESSYERIALGSSISGTQNKLGVGGQEGRPGLTLIHTTPRFEVEYDMFRERNPIHTSHRARAGDEGLKVVLATSNVILPPIAATLDERLSLDPHNKAPTPWMANNNTKSN